MHTVSAFRQIALVALLVALVAVACTTAATPTVPIPTSTTAPTATVPAPTATPNPFADVPGILDPDNFGWPREVEGLNGRITIPAKPERIITASIGHDEITLALIPASRLVGVGAISKDPTYSNVANLIQDVAEISRDPEVIIAQSPDTMVVSAFMSAESIDALTRVGIPVVQTSLSNDAETRIDTILFMGYVYGEEARAVELAAEIRDRYESLIAITLDKPQDSRPRVMAVTRYSDQIWTAGIDSTEGSIIDAAGGINVAAEAGIEKNNTTSLEGVISMAPEVIFIAQPLEFGAEELRTDLLNNPALAEVPAIKNERVYLVEGNAFTTLSYWNLIGVEELIRILWPEDMADVQFDPFSLPQA